MQYLVRYGLEAEEAAPTTFVNTELGDVSPAMAAKLEAQNPAEQNHVPMTDSSGGDTVMDIPLESLNNAIKLKEDANNVVNDQGQLALSESSTANVPNLPSSIKEDPAAVDAPMSPRSVANEDASVLLRQASESLNNFLITELQLFTARLLGVNTPLSVGCDDGVAQTTSLQLYLAHQRSLMDFDADNSRYATITSAKLLNCQDLMIVCSCTDFICGNSTSSIQPTMP